MDLPRRLGRPGVPTGEKISADERRRHVALQHRCGTDTLVCAVRGRHAQPGWSGQGVPRYPKTFLLRGQTAKGQKL
jgi:hypothetical protein